MIPEFRRSVYSLYILDYYICDQSPRNESEVANLRIWVMHTIEKNRTSALIWYQNYLYHTIFDKGIAENLSMIFMNSRHE